MKKLCLLVAVSFVVLATLSAAAQETAKRPDGTAQHAKTIRVSGKISDDGTKFVQENQRAWIVTNPGMLKGYEGQQVVLRGRRQADTNLIQVLSIKGQTTYTANSGDSAFRR